MNTMRQNKYLVVLLMLVAVFAACKGESPTSPPITGGGGGGGGTTPPVGSAVTLTVSPANPQVSKTSVVTATVTLNNQPVANGTAVEFTTNFGTFVETGTAAALRTTTGGVATVTLTSASAGTATVQAVVNNVIRTTTISFQALPVETCPPTCPPVVTTITGIAPAIGSPAGGESVTITGTNFLAPVRVFFDFGGGVRKEANVVSRTDTQIVVTTPPVDVVPGTPKNATIVVVTGAGTATEKSTSAATPFVYQIEVLTPVVSAVSPDSGPIDGGTRITIFGTGFQSPVLVSFAPGSSAGAGGWTAMQVVSVGFSQIIAVTPPARDVNANGSGALTGGVDLRVRNINSNTEVVKSVVFRYVQKMQITATGPSQGPITGGTTVVIDGVGFNDPVAVSIGGFAAQPIKVTGSQVTAVTASIVPTSCADVTGPISVTNIDNGDSASGGNFTFKVPKPTIIGVSPTTVSQGGSVTVTVANAINGTTKITIGDKTAFLTASSISSAGVGTFTVTVPSNFTFATQACTVGSVTGVQQVPLSVNVSYTNVETTCSDTVSGVLTISPPSSACVIPAAPVGVVSPTPPACAVTTPASPSAAGAATGTATLTVLNTAPAGSQNLVITSASFTTQTNGAFSIAPTTASIAPGGSQAFTVTVDPTAAGAFNGVVTFTSNNASTLTGCVSGIAAP